jgi:hypothetical protein
VRLAQPLAVPAPGIAHFNDRLDLHQRMIQNVSIALWPVSGRRRLQEAMEMMKTAAD